MFMMPLRSLGVRCGILVVETIAKIRLAYFQEQKTIKQICRELRVPRNTVRKESRAVFMAIAQRLVDRGADCLILGCTEVGMLLDQGDVPVPVFDTTQVYCEAAFAAALNA